MATVPNVSGLHKCWNFVLIWCRFCELQHMDQNWLSKEKWKHKLNETGSTKYQAERNLTQKSVSKLYSGTNVWPAKCG